MRKIAVTGGFSGPVVVDLGDKLGSLADADFAVALVPVNNDYPAVGHADWKDPEVSGLTAKSAKLTLTVTDAYDPGDYNVAIDVQDGSDHQLSWAVDSGSRQSRSLVRLV